MNRKSTPDRQPEIIKVDAGSLERWQTLAGLPTLHGTAGVERHLEIVVEQYHALCLILHGVKEHESLVSLAAQYERELGALRFVKDTLDADDTPAPHVMARVEEIIRSPRPFSDLAIRVAPYETEHSRVQTSVSQSAVSDLLAQHKKQTVDELYENAVAKFKPATEDSVP